MSVLPPGSKELLLEGDIADRVDPDGDVGVGAPDAGVLRDEVELLDRDRS